MTRFNSGEVQGKKVAGAAKDGRIAHTNVPPGAQEQGRAPEEARSCIQGEARQHRLRAGRVQRETSSCWQPASSR